MPNIEELLAKANKPAQEALRLHPLYRGKVATLRQGQQASSGSAAPASTVPRQSSHLAQVPRAQL